MSFSISEKGLRVVRGTPQVGEGQGGSDSIAASAQITIPNRFPQNRDFLMGPAKSPMGPQFAKGTRISQMGPYLVRDTCSPEGYSIRRSCSKRVLGAGRHRTKVLLVQRPYAAARGCAPLPGGFGWLPHEAGRLLWLGYCLPLLTGGH
jgi:hypothetical protein